MIYYKDKDSIPHELSCDDETCLPRGCTVITPAEHQALAPKTLIASLSAAVQKYLDDTAKVRGYDGILSACTYATDTHPPFKAEGQACVNWRGSVWSTCYAIMAQVQAGTHPMPTEASLIAELPVMVWP